MSQYEIEKARREVEEMKKKLKKKQQEAEELALMGFMAGRSGNGYAQWASGEI